MAAGPLESTDPRTLGGFEIVARLGEGGQGVVYEGWSAAGERVAIKVLKGGTDPVTRRRLARELEAARSVAPFCTARVFAAELDRPEPYVVSEFVAGPSLHDRVKTGGPLRDGDLDRLAVGTASALAAIHAAGIVHRDFKPGNVLLGPDGPRVVDFGIARPLDGATATSELTGTPPYMAPEQLRGVPASAGADVFAWAATMVFAATGRAPFGQDTVASVFHRLLSAPPDLAGVPESLLPVLRDCLAKDPEHRPTAKELMIRLVDPTRDPTAVLAPDLTRFIGTTAPTMASPTAMLGVSDRRVSRRAIAAIVTGAAVVVAIVAFFLINQGTTLPSGGPSEPVVSAETGTEPGTTSEPATGTTSGPATGTLVSGVFAGTWKGDVVSQDGRKKTYDLTIILGEGDREGYAIRPGCEQALRVTRNRGNALDLSMEQQGQCVGGDITLTSSGGDTLVYVGQEGGGSLSYRGELSRSS
ncbi:serine/threonine-protein kinase [Acrocarpospora sp. B8E8]|uniref:serine/threonine-protein kinase n=1 Tax=Acrocarpospora sp. B8E8 TaxID=3153572 RepID=UPI00325D9686